MTDRKFDDDPNSPSRKLALQLARADEELHAKLLKARDLRKLTQEQVAEVMGVRQPTVASFERYDNDPRLSTIRRYAHAVGATVTHSVLVDGSEVECGWTHFGEAEFGFVAPTVKLLSHRTPAPSISISDLTLAA